MSNQRSLGRFEVERPLSYESFPLAPAEAELKESAKKMQAEMVVSPPGTTFSVMGKSTRHIREQLAAVVQSLIQDYKNRPYPWVNVYSRNDVICGHLDFYDLPNTLIPAKAKPVYNVRDEESLIPLVAHVEYWNNRTVWNELFAEITHITGSPEIPRTPEDEGPGPLGRGFNYLRNKFLAMKNTLAGRSARRRMK
jgi:hypothetical protein